MHNSQDRSIEESSAQKMANQAWGGSDRGGWRGVGAPDRTKAWHPTESQECHSELPGSARHVGIRFTPLGVGEVCLGSMIGRAQNITYEGTFFVVIGTFRSSLLSNVSLSIFRDEVD